MGTARLDFACKLFVAAWRPRASGWPESRPGDGTPGCLRRDIYTLRQSKPRDDRLQINEPGALKPLRERKPLGDVCLWRVGPLRDRHCGLRGLQGKGWQGPQGIRSS